MGVSVRGTQKLPEVFDDHDAYVSGERRLMMAVLVEAINDAVGVPRGCQDLKERNLVKFRARLWFERNSRDFQLVCISAGFDPDHVRAKVAECISTAARMPRRYEGKPHTVPIAA